MKRLAMLLAVMGALVCAPSTAEAKKPARVTIARPLLPQPLPTVQWAPCPDAHHALGCYYASSHTMFISDRSAYTYWHEMGHAYDVTRLDPGDRAKFSRLIGRSGKPWRSLETHGLFRQSTDEAFADAYQACRRKQRPSGMLWDSVVYQPKTDKGHAAVCRFITRAI